MPKNTRLSWVSRNLRLLIGFLLFCQIQWLEPFLHSSQVMEKWWQRNIKQIINKKLFNNSIETDIIWFEAILTLSETHISYDSWRLTFTSDLKTYAFRHHLNSLFDSNNSSSDVRQLSKSYVRQLSESIVRRIVIETTFTLIRVLTQLWSTAVNGSEKTQTHPQ